MSEAVIGLDIGTTKIACLVGVMNEHNKLEIMSMGHAKSYGVKRGMVANIEQTVHSIREAVQMAVDNFEGQMQVNTVNVGIAGQHIKSMQTRGMLTRKIADEVIAQMDVDKLIEDMYHMAVLPGEEIIHVLPQDYSIDGEPGIKNPIGHAGSRLEANFHVITGQMSAARNIKKCVNQAGYEIQDIILEPLASASAVLSDEELEAGVCLVDIGGGTTDVAIFQDGIIRHTAVIPFGGNIITEDIKEGCNIMHKYAEKLKVQFGSALRHEAQENEVVSIPGLRGRAPKEISVKNLAGIIEARVAEIVEQVYYEIRSCGFERKLLGGIVLTGGGSKLKHLNQLVEYITGMDSRIGYPNEHLASNREWEELKSPIFATGVGLVLRGFEDQSITKASEEVKGYSKADRGAFFQKLLSKAKDMFEAEDE